MLVSICGALFLRKLLFRWSSGGQMPSPFGQLRTVCLWEALFGKCLFLGLNHTCWIVLGQAHQEPTEVIFINVHFKFLTGVHYERYGEGVERGVLAWKEGMSSVVLNEISRQCRGWDSLRFCPHIALYLLCTIETVSSSQPKKIFQFCGPTLPGLPESTAQSGADVPWLKSASKLTI